MMMALNLFSYLKIRKNFHIFCAFPTFPRHDDISQVQNSQRFL